MNAEGADINLRPISSNGSHSIIGNEIIMPAGGQRVTLEVKVSNWDPGLQGLVLIRTYQSTLTGTTGYSSGLQGVLAPASQSCTNNAQCVAAFGGGSCGNATNPPVGFCKSGFLVTSRADWLFTGISTVTGVDVSTLDYRYGATTQNAGEGTLDDGTVKYAGSLILDVPANALGTFTIGFENFGTFLIDPGDVVIPRTTFPALITIPAGSCCTGFPNPTCQITTQATCTGLGGVYTAGANCSGPLPCPCQNNGQCSDGTACTNDVCGGGGTCTNPLVNPNGTCANGASCNVNLQDCADLSTCESNFCCNPSTGSLTQIDDGNACRDDLCNPGTGQVTHPPFSAGTACGDPADTECTDPDICDGLGSCVANHASAGTSCGIGDDTDCTNPDTCNASGACLDNHAANGSTCDDTIFCNVGETCTGGACGGGGPRDCSDGLPCTTDICNEQASQCENTLDGGFCLIGGVCYADGDFNPANDCQECDTSASTTDWTDRAAGSLCDDGDPCTGTGEPSVGDDTCDGLGVCSGQVDPACNDNCDDAIPVAEGTTNFGTNANRGPDDAEASCQADSNNDVWFVYRPICTGPVFISTTGSLFAPSNDPVLSVWNECGVTELACDDDSGFELQAALVTNVTLGEDYFIRVAGFEDNVGPITLNIFTVDGCLIDGVCYAEGDRNPANDCEGCMPDVSTVAWTSLMEGTTCGDPGLTECDNPDACDGFGLCEENHKPDGILCTDDGNECTFDACDTGVCDHPPRPSGTACGDPTDTECDNADSCDGASACLDNFEPLGTACGDPTDTQCDHSDICTGTGGCDDNLEVDGTTCDDGDVCTAGDECATGLCVGTPDLAAPIVTAIGSRRLSVTPQPTGSQAPMALRVKSTPWPCLDKFVRADGTLGLVAVFQTPLTWGSVIVRGQDIIPFTPYTVVAECGAFVSAPDTDTTWHWGDHNHDGLVNFIDIQIVVEFFQQIPPPGIDFVNVDMYPCTPDGNIDFRDIAREVDAFILRPYPCGQPCQ